MESEALIGSTIVLSLFAGACGLLLLYIVRVLNGEQQSQQKPAAPDAHLPKNEKTHQQPDKRKNSAVSQKRKKRAMAERTSNWNDNFVHPWMSATLKGHTTEVLSADYSSNQRYLISSAEAEDSVFRDTIQLDDTSNSSSGSSSVGDIGTPDLKSRSKGLSRRQRKNRRREISPSESSKKSRSRDASNTNPDLSDSDLSIFEPVDRLKNVPLQEYTKLNLPLYEIPKYLGSYTLSKEQMMNSGYPVESRLTGLVMIFKTSYPQINKLNDEEARLKFEKSKLDVNNPEFIPGVPYQDIKASPKEKYDSGHSSDNPSSSAEDSGWSSSSTDLNGSAENLSQSPDKIIHRVPNKKSKAKKGILDANNPEFVPGVSYQKTKAAYYKQKPDSEQGDSTSSSEDFEERHAIRIDKSTQTSPSKVATPKNSPHESSSSQSPETIKKIDLNDSITQHTCTRCGELFALKNCREYLSHNKCQYHFGKLWYSSTAYKRHNSNSEYTCCKGGPTSAGCSFGKNHVWSGLRLGLNGPLQGYVKTKPRKLYLSPVSAYAIDCEMCYTACGLELSRVTVISTNGALIYDCYVRPDNPIVDYNTRYSGIKPIHLSKGGPAKTLQEVQSDLLSFIFEDTFLIGHGLENDLRALKILHGNVVDTAIAFPHWKGPPYRRSLKSLASYCLKREIQCDDGHDSVEDAQASMELILFKIRTEFKDLIPYHHTLM